MSVVMNSIQSETFVECFKNLGMAFDKLSNTQLLPKGTIYNDENFDSLPSQNKNFSSKKTNSNLSEKNETNENEKNSLENNSFDLDNISITKKTLRKNIQETINKEENNFKKEKKKKKRKKKKKKKN